MAAGLVAMNSCTDTWNDHYDVGSSSSFNGTTMQAIENEAPNFAKVIKAYGYDRELASDNVYTVWAPADGSFNLSDYVDDNGRRCADSTSVVKEFIKNHIARYSVSYNGSDIAIDFMNEKRLSMGETGNLGEAAMQKSNIACKNGVVHVIDKVVPYNYNLFEMIAKQYSTDATPGKDSISLYAYLYDAENNKDSLIENKSVSRGVDENGDKIWVDSFVLKNNTVLKNVDAKIYEEDSSFIAIIPTAKAWAERYQKAADLLKFNPYEDQKSQGACDSLTRHYANTFAMTDLFYNKNANEHWQDSLKSTLYRRYDWEFNCYYSKMPKDMPEGKQVNDILSKCGKPISCSNGDAYIVDEYPMSIYEQFFRKISVPASSSTIDQTLDSKGNPEYTKNVSTSFRRTSGSFSQKFTNAEGEETVTKENFSFVDIVPSSASVNPYVAFQIDNTLSGTYDLFLVTCPIWLNSNGSINLDDEDNTRGYRFYVNVIERQNEGDAIGQYSGNGERLANPDGSGNYFITKGIRLNADSTGIVINDTTYLGQYTFKNCYYGRNNEGVLIQVQSQISSKLTKEYSREMLISGVILKPHDDNNPVIVVPATPAEGVAEAKLRNRKFICSIKKD